MNIITRHLINKDILLYEHDHQTKQLLKIHNYDDFCDIIDKWKIILIEKYNVKPGQTICLTAGPDLFYYALFFAVAELGLIFIVDWPHAHSKNDLHNNVKISMFGKIDFIYALKSFHDPEATHTHCATYDADRDHLYGKQMIYLDDFHDYQAVNNELVNSVKNICWATPESNLIHSCSSGTTGIPKKVIESHKKIHTLSTRISNIYFEKNLSALHTNVMHHGHTIVLHFLPSFIKAKEHYTWALGLTYQGDVTDFVIKNKINHLFLFVPDFLLNFLRNTPRLDHKVNIVTLYQITPECVQLIKEKNINFIKSPFGDSTIGSGFFVKTADKHTDLTTYDVTEMGAPLDDFYQLELRNNILYVKCDYLNEDWKTSNDRFDIVNGHWYFQGRANSFRINGEWIQLGDLENKVRKLFGLNNAHVIIDNEMQKVYLAVWEENTEAEKNLNRYLEDTYQMVKIDYVLRDEDYIEFFNSRKIDNEKIRRVCREKLFQVMNLS